MEIIQTIWPCNSLNHFEKQWLKPENFYISLALNNLFLQRSNRTIKLYGNEYSCRLVKNIGLKFDQVYDCYPKNSNNDALWARGKVQTYAYQTNPFIHIDLDVILTPQSLLNIELKKLIAQSPEINFPGYAGVLKKILGYKEVNKLFSDLEFDPTNLESINAGVFGGNEIDFISDYSENALKLCDVVKDLNCLTKAELHNFNMVYEQFYLSCLAKKEDIEISFFIDYVSQTHDEILKLHLFPILRNYIHIIGYAKHDTTVNHFLPYLLRYIDNSCFDEIFNFLKSNQFDFDIEEKEYSRLETYYNTLENHSIQEIKSLRIEINPEIRLENNYVEFYSPAFKCILRENRNKGNNDLLSFFSQGASINDLVSEMLDDQQIQAKFPEERLIDICLDSSLSLMFYDNKLKFS